MSSEEIRRECLGKYARMSQIKEIELVAIKERSKVKVSRIRVSSKEVRSEC